MRQWGCWSKFTSTISDEFQLQNIRLNHFAVEDFYRSQWQKGSRSFWFLLYRWCVAVFFLAALVATAVKFFDNGRFLIYLTDLGFILCTIVSIYGAVLATLWYFDRVDAVEQSWNVQIFWVLHWSALVLATVISVIFWSLLLKEVPSIAGNPYNIMVHACNSLVMLIDHFVVAFPSRILHFVYPLAIGIIYCIFTLIYYFSGGTGIAGAKYIYPILDWGEAPLMACGTVLLAIVCCFVFSFVLFWIYKLRVYLHETFASTEGSHKMSW